MLCHRCQPCPIPHHAHPLCHAHSWLKRARHVLQRLQPAFPDMRVSLGLGASEDLDAVDSVYVWVSGIPVGFQARFPTLLLGTSYQSTPCTAAPCECTCTYLGWGVHCLPPTPGAAAPRCPRCLAAPRPLNHPCPGCGTMPCPCAPTALHLCDLPHVQIRCVPHHGRRHRGVHSGPDCIVRSALVLARARLWRAS